MKTHSTHPTCQTPGYRMPDIDHCLEDPQIRDISMKARARYANIMYDTAFKLVFGSEANKSLLIELLEALIPGKKISDVTFHAAELAGMTLDERNQYDQDMTTEIDKIAQLDYAKEQGREEGLLLAAQNLKAEGIPVEMICRATDLSQETVHALK